MWRYVGLVFLLFPLSCTSDHCQGTHLFSIVSSLKNCSSEMPNFEERNAIIIEYFHRGFSHGEIALFLQRFHSCSISQRQVRRILASHGKYTRNNHSPIENVIDFIHKQLKTSSVMCGYRMMHKKCKNHGLFVPRNIVQGIMKTLDPVGTESRRSHCLQRRQYNGHGPNFIWHADCYDKLKKSYGFCISGCIDGYSRKLLWLEVSRNSSDPAVIAGHYVNTVERFGGCPRILRVDRGTENVTMCNIQQWLRQNDDDAFADEKSVMFGRSTANQRIEQWWGYLRKHWSQFWMNIFKGLARDGYFTGSWLDRNLLQFCFMRQIQVRCKFFSSISFSTSMYNINKLGMK